MLHPQAPPRRARLARLQQVQVLRLRLRVQRVRLLLNRRFHRRQHHRRQHHCRQRHNRQQQPLKLRLHIPLFLKPHPHRLPLLLKRLLSRVQYLKVPVFKLPSLRFQALLLQQPRHKLLAHPPKRRLLRLQAPLHRLALPKSRANRV